MLNFKKSKTDITLLEDGKTISCTRIVSNRIYLIVTKCDGTTIGFTTMCNRLVGFDDELFMSFDSIRKSEELELDEPLQSI